MVAIIINNNNNNNNRCILSLSQAYFKNTELKISGRTNSVAKKSL